jgi:hypothetical protein
MGIDTQLTLSEERSLVELEAVIERGKWTFLQVGKALTEIRDLRLYRNAYDTFEDYCRERWRLSRPAAYQYIGASTVVENLSTQVDKESSPVVAGNLTTQAVKAPPSFTQARELASLEPEKQREVASTVNFANTTVKALKDRIEQVKAGARRRRGMKQTVKTPSSNDAPIVATEEPRPAPGVSLVRPDALCQMCRERLFPQQALKQDSPVDIEPTPDQAAVEVEYEYDAEYAQPEPVVDAKSVTTKPGARYRI